MMNIRMSHLFSSDYLTYGSEIEKRFAVVGDPDQSIFSFAGSSNEYLLDFTKRYPEAEVLRLNRNYRSTSQIVNVCK